VVDNRTRHADVATSPARITRRQFLRRAGTAAAVLGAAGASSTLVSGCGSTEPRRRSAGSATATTAPATTTTAPATTTRPPDWTRLAGTLAGTLVLPTNPSYGTDKLLFNERFDTTAPAAIAYCQTPADVQRCVEFAGAHELAFAARSGGHSYGGYSSCSGLVADVSRMGAVRVAATRATATVGAGAGLIDLYSTLGAAGVLVPGGSCPTVGVAGLALGGGIGVLGRNYGLTCDNLVSVDLVTADGRLLTCDPSQNEDLYWASRGGGGGNFGVATSFTFRVHPIPTVSLFTLEWPWTAATTVLGTWQDWVATLPDAVWSNCQLLSSGSATPTGPSLKVTGVAAAGSSTLSSALAPLRTAVRSSPSYTYVGTQPYLTAMLIEAGCEGSTVAECHLPSENPAGTLSRSAFDAKSSFIANPLPGAGIAGLIGAVEALDQQVPQVGGGFVFDSYGGEINRVAADATAFVHRSELACIQYSVTWSTTAALSVVDAATSWLTTAQSLLAPYATGSYQNYIDPTLPDWLDAYYGSNLSRLVRVKRAVDPDDFFHFAQSIPTHLPR